MDVVRPKCNAETNLRNVLAAMNSTILFIVFFFLYSYDNSDGTRNKHMLHLVLSGNSFQNTST